MISDLITPALINVNLQSTTKEAVFQELAQMLLDQGRIQDKMGFLDDVQTRESLSVTSMDGIAYPHTKSRFVIEPAIAVGIHRNGIEYGDEDGIKPTVFFMIASPDNGADHHIYVLQELFGKFSDEFVAEMHQATDANQVLATLLQS